MAGFIAKDADNVLTLIKANHPEITVIALPESIKDPSKDSQVLKPLNSQIDGYRTALSCAISGDAQEALAALAFVRVLCGHH